MARPFILLGTVIFATLTAITCLPTHTVPYIIGISAVSGILCLLLGIKLKFMKTVFVVFLAVCLASTSYFLRTGFTYYPALELATENTAIITGRLKDVSENNNNYYYFLDDISVNNSDKTIHKIRISHKNLFNVSIDDIMTFKVSNINAYSERDLFTMPDEDGIHLYAYSYTAPEITKAQRHSSHYYLTNLRVAIAEILYNNMEPDSSGAVNAMLTGDKSQLSDSVMQKFSHSGISHLFAVSGFHLSLWTSAIFIFFEKLNSKMRLFGNIFAVAFILFFMTLTGFTPSVVRAGIMMLIFIAGQLTKYKSDSVNSLFIALSFILLINPFSVTSISLQMSFLATLGIVTLGGAVTEPITKLRKKIKPKIVFNTIQTLYTICMISLIATVFTSPVSAGTFGYNAFLGTVTNILCLPAAQLILPLSSIGLIFSFLRPVSAFFFNICELIMKYILFVAGKISSSPVSTINTRIVPFSIALFVILAATVILICFFERKNRILRIISAVSICSYLIVSVSAAVYTNNSYTFYVSSVGNGSATVCNIKGKTIILGCGGEDYKDYVFTSSLSSISFSDFDLLLIPRTTETESAYADTLLERFYFSSVVTCADNFGEYTEKILPSDSVRSDLLKITIDEDTILLYINNDDFSGARIESADFRCTILFRPTSDFSTVPQEWSSGNLLISRQNLPETTTEFGRIIISTDSVVPFDYPHIKATSLDGNITYTFNKFTGAGCYADK